MINAILEITIMLLGSFGIGLLVARQFWQPKLKDSQNREEESHNKAVQAEVDYRMELKKITDSREQSQRYQKELIESRDNLDEIAKKQEKRIWALEAELKSKKEEVESLKQMNEKKEQDASLKPVDQEKVVEAINVIRTQRGKPKVAAIQHPEKSKTKEKPQRSKAYYEVIDGRKYDKAILDVTREAVAGRGDGRISMKDAEKIYKVVDDANQYTDIEKGTLKYIRENFNWTDASDQWFRKSVRSWAAKRGWENQSV